MLEADFHREYRLDLVGVLSGGMSWRKTWNLICQLPSNSNSIQAIHPSAAAWDTTEHLLATIVDSLQAANWQRSGGKKHRRPKPVTRPGTKPTTSTIGTASMTPNEIDDVLAERQQRRGDDGN